GGRRSGVAGRGGPGRGGGGRHRALLGDEPEDSGRGGAGGGAPAASRGGPRHRDTARTIVADEVAESGPVGGAVGPRERQKRGRVRALGCEWGCSQGGRGRFTGSRARGRGPSPGRAPPCVSPVP